MKKASDSISRSKGSNSNSNLNKAGVDQDLKSTQLSLEPSSESQVVHSIVSPRLANYFLDYGSYHQSVGNQRCHIFGITLIVIGLLGLLSGLGGDIWGSFQPEGFFRVDLGMALVVLVGLWYVYLDWKIAGPFILVALGLYFLGRALPSSVCWALFGVGWVLQGVGHKFYEKKAPAFFHNFLHLLIGPIWLFAKIVGYR